ncbi:hypothetical protein RKD19_006008 [Streptomyces canus]
MNAQSPQPSQGNPKPQQQPPQQRAEPDKAAGSDQGNGPEQPQSDVIGGAAADPLGEEALPGAAAAASRIYRSTVSSHGSGTLISSGSVQTMNFYGGQTAERLLAGPLPEDELRRLRRVFQEPEDYDTYRGQLRGGQLLVLLGRPGTGRFYTALSLLDDLTRGQVSRLDPRTDLDKLDDGQIDEGHGYVLEPGTTGLPDETGLDRLCELLRKKQAYAVLLATPEPGDMLSRSGRYHRVHTPAAQTAVLEGHLADELDEAGPEAYERARAMALDPEVVEACGLNDLLPAEAAHFATLLARQHPRRAQPRRTARRMPEVRREPGRRVVRRRCPLRDPRAVTGRGLPDRRRRPGRGLAQRRSRGRRGARLGTGRHRRSGGDPRPPAVQRRRRRPAGLRPRGRRTRHGGGRYRGGPRPHRALRG